MTSMRKMTFEVPEELAVEIDAEVTSGAYNDIRQFVVESLESRLHPDRYTERTSGIERWLVEEVSPTYDAYKADPSRLMTEEEVFDGLEERLSSRVDQA